jgi:ATP-dependent DNA helicase RecQ
MCLGETENVVDATVDAQKILSCVARVRESFGIRHVLDVVRGADTDAIRKWRHHALSTYGLLRGTSTGQIRDMIFQLLDQGLLVSTGGEKPVLKLNQDSWSVMRGQRPVQFIRVRSSVESGTTDDANAWEGVHRGLFDALRTVRMDLALERGVAAFVIAGDRTLRELARLRPSTIEGLRVIHGMGERKINDLGGCLTNCIVQFCQQNDLTMDVPDKQRRSFEATTTTSSSTRSKLSPKTLAVTFAMFDEGCSLDEAAARSSLSRDTAAKYLAAFIEQRRPPNIARWVIADVYSRAKAAFEALGMDRLKPVHEYLNGEIAYDELHLVRAHLRSH